MAKCNSMMGEFSGSMGGCTWSRNKGGQYIRKRSVPTNPNTLTQQIIRGALSNGSTSWSRDLTNTQRQQWRDWAAVNPIVDTLGQSIQLTGQQAYVQFACRCFNLGMSASAVPPNVAAPVAPDPLTYSVTQTAAGVLTLTFTPTPAPAGYFIQVWTSPVHKSSQKPNQRLVKLRGVTSALQASPAAFFGPVGTVGMVVTVWLNAMDVFGQVSPAIRKDVTLT